MPPLTQFIKFYKLREYRVKCQGCGEWLNDGDEARFEKFEFGWKISHSSCPAYEDSLPARAKKTAVSDVERTEKMMRDWIEKRDAGILPCAHQYKTAEVE